MPNILNNICKHALAEGQKIDLNNCFYGPAHGTGAFVDKPFRYYSFLAGLVKSQRLTQVLEIGTHWGGSIMAMSAGITKSALKKCNLVTVDIKALNTETLEEFSHIKRIHGDALNPETAKEILRSFSTSVDILFIDSVHTYEHVLPCIDLYAARLNPTYIILDDIHLNGSMRKAWTELEKKFTDRTSDLSLLVERKREGFGIILHNLSRLNHRDSLLDKFKKKIGWKCR